MIFRYGLMRSHPKIQTLATEVDFDDEKVSAVIPCHNSKNTIARSINSIIAQKYENWEIVIVDDASSDDSLDFIRDRYKHLLGNKIKIISNERNQGAGPCRNAGVVISRGRYIAFLDSDDAWLPDKLSLQIPFTNYANACLTYTGYYTRDDSLDAVVGKYEPPQRTSTTRILSTNHIGCSTVIIDRKKISRVIMPNIRRRQDHALWISLAHKGHTLVGIRRPLAIYSVGGNSISSNKLVAARDTLKMLNSTLRLSPLETLLHFSLYALLAIPKRFAYSASKQAGRQAGADNNNSA